MSVRDKLQIVIITYNRADKLRRTLEQILSPTSPIRDFAITILDNHSNDQTKSVVDDFRCRFPNLTHVCHKYNAGGNVNITRAMEVSDKEYTWTLCDDDVYDWAGWPELESCIEAKMPMICVARYLISSATRDLPEYQLFQMSFVPATVMRTDMLSDTLFRNAYDCVFAMFPHLVPVVMHLNRGGKIHVLEHALVNNELDPSTNTSYIRGASQSEIFQRSKTMIWMVGYCNLIANLKDRQLMHRAFTAVFSKQAQGSAMSYYEFFAQLFLTLHGAENRMHVVDLLIAAPFIQRIAIRLVRFLSCSPFYWLALWVYHRRHPNI